jgi:predicted AAA+ superfamily ATPase
MSLLDKVKETAQKGVDKTKEAVNTGQEKLEERKLEKQISDLKEELGGLVYGQKTGAAADNAESEIARIVGEITSTQAELAKFADDAPEAATG